MLSVYLLGLYVFVCASEAKKIIKQKKQLQRP